MTRWLLAIALECCRLSGLPINTQSQPSSFGHQTWATENGLPQNTVHSVLQTRDGYIWLATEGGLARFDGLQFRIFNSQNTPQLRSNNIRSLVEDRMGRLWIATADGVTRIDSSGRITFTVSDGLPNNNVWSVYEDRTGALWAVTAAGLARFEGTRFKFYPETGGISSSFSGAMAEDVDGTLWIGTRAGLKLFRHGLWVDPAASLQLPKNNIEVILSDRSGRMWIGTQDGLYVRERGRLQAYRVAKGLPGNKISSLYKDRNGYLWIGTDAGLATLEKGEIVPISYTDTFSGNTILAISEDREGSHWIGTESNGVTILRKQKFTSYTGREGVSDDPVRCVFEDRAGVVWIGTDEHGLRRYRNGAFTPITTRNGLSSDVILALAEDRDGSLLVGTPDGLNRIKNGAISLISSAEGLPDDFIRSILSSDDGSLWIGTRRGLSHVVGQRVTTYTTSDGLGSDLVGALLNGGPDDLWIATLHGLTRFRSGRFTNYTTKDGLSSDVITALYRDGQGVLWIGTEGGGLNRFQSEKFTHILTSVGLPNVIYGVAEDAGHDLWISSSTGIYRVSKLELNRVADGTPNSVSAVSYGTSDGLRINECSGGGHPALWKRKDGSIWFATLKGVAVLHAGQDHLNRVAPPVVIESVSADDEIFDPTKLSRIPPGHSRFSFEYAGLSFIAPSKVRFRYKLEGFDRDWVDAGTRRIAYYTNLPPRYYHFRVLACNNDGIWNEKGASLNFELQPHFYQTYWFDALVLLALAGLGFTGYRLRVRQVEAQFNAVLQERNRIAREIHDTLAQGFAAVSVQLEIVSRLLSSSADAAREHLDQARVLVRNSLAEARSSIWELRSQSPENEDLAARLSKMAARMAGSASGKITVRVHGTYRPLAPKVENELVKIAQEAVTNAIRHAEAAHIGIELAFDTKRVRMMIADDGRGFAGNGNGSDPEGHFGIQGMRERAQQIQAELTVQSTPGKGTKVSVETAIN